MFAEADMKTGAIYVLLSEASVARTLHVSDVIMVDVDEDDTPVGIEFAVPVASVDQHDWHALAEVVPEVKEIFAKSFPS
jgi:uncharacterized protein YuzE